MDIIVVKTDAACDNNSKFRFMGLGVAVFINGEYREAFENNGFHCVGENPETNLVEALELEGHPWYIGVQYHPEYNSTVVNPSPIFMGFIRAAVAYHNTK